MPEPREIVVTKWNADHDDSDPRMPVMDPKRRVLVGQPKTTLALWPWRFKDGSFISDDNGTPHEQAGRLFAQIEAFVKEGFPNSGRGKGEPVLDP